MMSITRLTRALVVALLAVVGPAAAQDSDRTGTLQERMNGEEFERAGLGKLTPQELEFLNQWLKDERPPPPPPTAPAQAQAQPAPEAVADTRGLRQKKQSSRTVIESQIDGDFTGWSGRTRFKLTNGMVWQQVGSGEFRHRAENPNVRIEPKSLGSWKLYIEGLSRSVKVKRIK